MKRILWLITTTRETPRTVEYVFKQARADAAGLDALFVQDEKLGQEVYKKLAHENFVGGGPSAELSASLTRDYGERGKLKFEDLTERAAKAGLTLNTHVRIGATAEACLALAKEIVPTEIVLTKLSGSRLCRFIFATAVDKIQALAPAKITFIEEEGIE